MSAPQSAIILHAGSSQGQRVVSCSRAAAEWGVRNGMSLAEATALVRSDSSPIVQEHSPTTDRAGLARLAEWCEQFSPLVGVEDNETPESLLLDITGIGPLFGGEQALADAVHQAFQRRGYLPRIAVANTIGLAWAAAHFAGQAFQPVGQTGMSAPPVIIAEQDRSLLYQLPIEGLRLPADAVALLRELGLTKIGQLLSLPRSDLAARFGPELVLRLDQATGAAVEVVTACRPLPDWIAEWSLEYPTAHQGTIEQIIARLVERLAAQLVEQNQGALQLECKLSCSGGRSVSFRVGLYQPTAQPRHLLELINLQLQQQSVPGLVHQVSVAALLTAPLVWRQHELWEETARKYPMELAALVNRLSSRLGQGHVVRPQLRAAAQPERAFQEIPLTKCGVRSAERGVKRRSALRTTNSALSSQSAIRNPQSAIPLDRPLRLFFPPVPLQVVSVVPDGPPILLRLENQAHHVARHWGPERIETSWWHGRSVRRDYYRVETNEGSRFWLFRRLQDGEWFLHGEFE